MRKRVDTQNRWQLFKNSTEELLLLDANTERTIEAIVSQGLRESYFGSEDEADDYKQELTHVIATHRAVFHPKIIADRRNYPATQSKNASQTENPRILSIKNNLMQAVLDNRQGDNKPETAKANRLFTKIVEETWLSNLQTTLEFTDNINEWHSAPHSGPIRLNNSLEGQIYLRDCEYTAASINLLKYLQDNGEFEIRAFQHTVDLLCIALDIVLGLRASLADGITKNTQRHRPLALGYINLPGLLMAQGLSYDSEEARAQAATITALMTGQAYLTSANLAHSFGAFAAFHQNRSTILSLIQKHRDEIAHIDARLVAEELHSAASGVWEDVLVLSHVNGLRNTQVTCLGSAKIFNLPDSEVSVLEPFMHSKSLKESEFITELTARALKVLNYRPSQIDEIIEHFVVNGTTDSIPHLKKTHLSVFTHLKDSASIIYNAQLKMMRVMQPFLSGGISCPINVLEPLSTEETQKLYLEAWQSGLKIFSLNLSGPNVSNWQESSTQNYLKSPPTSESEQKQMKLKLTDNTSSKVIPFNTNNTEGYLIVCEDNNGLPVKLIIKLFHDDIKQVRLADDIALLINLGLSKGVSIDEYINYMTSKEDKANNVNKKTTLVQCVLKNLAIHYEAHNNVNTD